MTDFIRGVVRLSKPAMYGALGLSLLTLPAYGQQSTNDTETRIRELEEKLRSTTETMLRELDSLKQELKAARERETESAAKSQRELEALKAANQKAVAPSEETKALQKELRETQAQVAEARDQLTTLQARADNIIPNARLAEGLVFDDPRGRWALRLTGRAQLDYRHYEEAGALADTFAIRRARVGVGLTMGRIWGSFVEAEFSSGAVGGGNATMGPTPGASTTTVLHQAYLDFNPYDQFRMRFGQFKPQFGLENTMTTWQHDFQERSLAFALSQNFLFDRGLMFHGAPYNGVYYGVSITNGAGQNFDEVQRSNTSARGDGKDLLFRLVGNAAAWLDQPNWVLHGGANYRTGDQANDAGGYIGPAGVTEARGLVFFSPEPFNNATGTATAGKIKREIQGIEAAVAYRNFKLQGEYFRAGYSGRLNTTDSVFERNIYAGYAAFNWMITGEHFADAYRNGVFGRIRPNNAFGINKGDGWGALELGLRYSIFDASDFGGQAANTGNTATSSALVRPSASPETTNLTRKATAYTVALKWMPTAYWAFMMNYVQTDFATPITANGVTLGKEQALTFRGQFDFF